MSVRYIVDGYNVIWSTEQFDANTLRARRELLLRTIESSRLAGSDRNQITVVFDGQEDVDSPPWRGSTKVIFSRGRNADDEIKRQVEFAANAREIVVVTDDKELQKWVRAYHAKTLSCGAFLRRGRRDARGSRAADIDERVLARVTEELKRIWKL